MPVKLKVDPVDIEEAVAEENGFDPLKEPGYHVVAGGRFVGTYETEEDAQAFINGHVKPQDIEAKIVAVEDEPADEA